MCADLGVVLREAFLVVIIADETSVGGYDGTLLNDDLFSGETRD